ncbi:hypothetical protein ACLOJK_031778 [Asimina triloba]
MFSQRDPTLRKTGQANVFIKNLDSTIDNKALFDTFSTFGTILSCKVATDGNGQSKGYGFVHFQQEESAQNAIKRLNGMLINDKQVYVGFFVHRQERNQTDGSQNFTNVYVKNLSEGTTDEDLKNVFGTYGPITSAVIMCDVSGKSRGFGFVNFQNPEDAAAAVENLNNSLFNEKVWYVGKAQRKSERVAELKAKYEQERSDRFAKLQGANLYMKNLKDDIDDEKLKELFSEFGTITSCKVLLDSHGHSRGCGFVAFSTPEEANRARTEMSGKYMGKKPLYVAVAQRREERKAKLQAHFAQFRGQGVAANLPSSVSGFHPGVPRLAPQQLYYGQGAPGPIPPQPAGYGFQQSLLPGFRPTVPPNFMMPYHLNQGQVGQRMGLQRGTPQQMQLQRQYGNFFLPRERIALLILIQRNANQGFRYIQNAHNRIDPLMVPQGPMGPMTPLPFDVSGVPLQHMDDAQSQPVPVTTLSSALASASLDQQRRMLGEQLYPLVDCLEHNFVGKVTGMLLEMDQTEVLHLIESPDALKKKVAEAMDVLQKEKAQNADSDTADQLGSLSLDD